MSMRIDGIATNQQLDSSGEILNVSGHDISDLVEGKGVLNFEHEKGPEDIIGAVVYAKKIIKEDDCENDRQRMYWQISGTPFVYIIGELFDDEEHPGSIAVAALIRYYAKRKEKLLVGFSIEGQTLERDGYKLERSVGRRVAVTLRPCNKSCVAGLLEDPQMKTIVAKAEGNPDNHTLYEVDTVILEDVAHSIDPWLDLKKSVELLNKTLTAGSAAAGPSRRVSGSALSMDDHTVKNKIRAAIRDWDRIRPLKEAIKAALPEVSDDYLDYFVNLTESVSLKKGNPIPKLLRVGVQHSDNDSADDDQKRLIEGLYIDPQSQYVPPQPNGQPAALKSPMFKLRNDAGEPVIIKECHPEQSELAPSWTASNATHFYQLAGRFFDMKQHVPTTNYFYYPGSQNQKGMQAIKYVDGQPLISLSPERYQQVIEKAKSDGTWHKLFLMDQILGSHNDRHLANMVIDRNDHIHLIDNDYAFMPDYGIDPVYLIEDDPAYVGDDQLHVEAKKWLDRMNPKRLAKMMSEYGMDKRQIAYAVQSLSLAKSLSDRGQNLREIHNMINLKFGGAP